MQKDFGVLALSALALVVSRANADNQPAPLQQDNSTWLQQWDQWTDQCGEQLEDWIDNLLDVPDDDDQGTGPVAAPELDPSAAIAALTLLSGGLAVVRGRRSRKRE